MNEEDEKAYKEFLRLVSKDIVKIGDIAREYEEKVIEIYMSGFSRGYYEYEGSEGRGFRNKSGNQIKEDLLKILRDEYPQSVKK
ncbi:hypothetical protein COU57_04045 [Candidatus Pacearchaeota archaeon CG10_big_fil_rev_8_21_14_0_10_32_14]|nr:MAG: hypothetical protein COU57_04045 [Candidatus Pacearchaeota archaeon CG10_big_fil_rev_8_21_14_0_10_32_14]